MTNITIRKMNNNIIVKISFPNKTDQNILINSIYTEKTTV